jgi:hypothetical protein
VKQWILVFAGLVAGLQACTWVKPTEASSQVVVGQAFSVGQCQKLGSTTVSVKANVGAFDRDKAKVESELTMLAQEEAVKMGGDTIVAQDVVKDGARAYEVYRCKAA